MGVAEDAVNELLFQDIKDYILDHDYTFDFKITEAPIGKKQNECFDNLTYLLVNKTTTGGFTGDECVGTISSELTKEKYVQYRYINNNCCRA